jgi:hypothetical protein
MNWAAVYEIIGYIASALIALSLTMSSILRLRVINLVGAVFFTVYGLLIQAYPVAAVNFFIILIDLYYLVEMYRAKEYFQLLEVRPDSVYLQRFLAFYAAEIERFLPGFTYDPARSSLVLFVLRNMVPAGLFIGEQQGDVLWVTLDFVIPGYRDFKVGPFVFAQNAAEFRKRGIRAIYTPPGEPAHEKYLRRMGFQPGCEHQGAACYGLEVRSG